jgi:hypothetical protein
MKRMMYGYQGDPSFWTAIVIMLVIAILCLSACAHPEDSSPHDLNPMCKVIDKCTYDTTTPIPKPLYDCESHVYQIGDLPISYFDGHSCIQTYVDFERINGVLVQGPGPAAF